MIPAVAVRALARTPVLRRAAAAATTPTMQRFASLSTTYSGGHPYEGQGGFYGSIKSRSDLAAEFIPGSRAEASDVKLLTALMDKWTAQSSALATPEEKQAAWETLAHEPANVELVKRLIVKGGPAWGLSVKQREFVSRFHPV